MGNQKPNADRSQNDPHPEVGSSTIGPLSQSRLRLRRSFLQSIQRPQHRLLQSVRSEQQGKRCNRIMHESRCTRSQKNCFGTTPFDFGDQK